MNKQVTDFFSDLQIAIAPPPDQESWAHGVTERAIGQVKETATLLQMSFPDQDPALTIAMAAGAVNNTEFVKAIPVCNGAFGKQTDLGEDELRQQLSIPVDRQQDEFFKLLSQRQHAEECARKARARTVITKLRNTSIRQPIRNYFLAEPVFIWRKFLPHEFHKGKRGGRQKTMRPRWVGPGRVVFHELVPGQEEGDRKHILWVVLANRMYRVSVHSVRPLSAREREILDSHGDDTRNWRQLTDVIPKREYTDLTHEEPADDEMEEPQLPPEGPEASVPLRPMVRFHGKRTPTAAGFPIDHPQVLPETEVNTYNDDDELIPAGPDGEEPAASSTLRSSRRSSTTSATPLIPGVEDAKDENLDPATEDTSKVIEPEPKRSKTDADDDDDLYMEAKRANIEIEDGYVMNIDIASDSKRQQKEFFRDPSVFLTKKVSSAEVCYRKLNPEEKALFDRAKDSEVSSFLRAQAVRRCLSYEEQARAQNSDRVLKLVGYWYGSPFPKKAAKKLSKTLEAIPRLCMIAQAAEKPKPALFFCATIILIWSYRHFQQRRQCSRT